MVPNFILSESVKIIACIGSKINKIGQESPTRGLLKTAKKNTRPNFEPLGPLEFNDLR